MQMLGPIDPACIVACVPAHEIACKDACMRAYIDMYALQHMFIYAIMCTIRHKRQKMYAIVNLCTKTCMHEKKNVRRDTYMCASV